MAQGLYVQAVEKQYSNEAFEFLIRNQKQPTLEDLLKLRGHSLFPQIRELASPEVLSEFDRQDSGIRVIVASAVLNDVEVDSTPKSMNPKAPLELRPLNIPGQPGLHGFADLVINVVNGQGQLVGWNRNGRICEFLSTEQIARAAKLGYRYCRPTWLSTEFVILDETLWQINGIDKGKFLLSFVFIKFQDAERTLLTFGCAADSSLCQEHGVIDSDYPAKFFENGARLLTVRLADELKPQLASLTPGRSYQVNLVLKERSDGSHQHLLATQIEPVT